MLFAISYLKDGLIQNQIFDIKYELVTETENDPVKSFVDELSTSLFITSDFQPEELFDYITTMGYIKKMYKLDLEIDEFIKESLKEFNIEIFKMN